MQASASVALQCLGAAGSAAIKLDRKFPSSVNCSLREISVLKLSSAKFALKIAVFSVLYDGCNTGNARSSPPSQMSNRLLWNL
jgi:hypothetical protein